MADEYTLYEKGNRSRQESAFGIAMARVIDVDSKKRSCTIVTFNGSGSMDDNSHKNCYWLSTDANPDGDESSYIPRRGTIGLAFFIKGAVYFWGAMNPIGKEATAANPKSPTNQVEGDKFISTLTGNRININRNGSIELYSSDTLRRKMYRTNDGIYRIQDMCGEYLLNVTDGGTILWLSNAATQASYYRAEFRKDLLKSYMITEEKGGVTPTIMSRTYIGPGIPGIDNIQTPVFTDEITVAGQRTTTLSLPQFPGTPAGFKSEIDGPLGSVTLKTGAFQNTTIEAATDGSLTATVNLGAAELNMNMTGDIDIQNLASSASLAKSGAIEVKNNFGKATISAKGDIEISNAIGTTISISAAGEVKITAPQKITMEAKTGIDVKSALGPINVESSAGPVSIKAKGIVSLDGGTGATDFVLTNPTTLSPFTGAPLAPFSKTVQVSK